MNDRRDSRGRRRPRGRKPAAEESREDGSGGTAPLPPEESNRRIGRRPAVDREAIAAREAGIYDEPEAPSAPEKREPARREPEEPRKERGRRRRRTSGPRRERTPRPAPEPEPAEEADLPDLDDEVDWDLPAEEPREVAA